MITVIAVITVMTVMTVIIVIAVMRMHLIKTEVQDHCGRIRPRPRTGRLTGVGGEGGRGLMPV